MNFTTLISGIVEQTTVLIARLATSAGTRAPLAHIANQVFVELAREIERRGVARKVAADMFGIALRSYQRKVSRITESLTDRNHTLWSAALRFIQQEGSVSRIRVLGRFSRDDPDTLGAVLHDLVESGLVAQSGPLPKRMYRSEDAPALPAHDEPDRITPFVWATIYQHGPLSFEALLSRTRVESGILEHSLNQLANEGRIEALPEGCWQSRLLVLPAEEPMGWETAVFHHYQSLVGAVCSKLDRAPERDSARPFIGGSTYEFLVWNGHAMEQEVLEFMAGVRRDASKLRAALTEHNDRVGRPEEPTRVTFYMGQTVLVGDRGLGI